MCRWIREDIARNGKLTGYPNDYTGAGTFPPQGKINHLELEHIIEPLDASAS